MFLCIQVLSAHAVPFQLFYLCKFSPWETTTLLPQVQAALLTLPTWIFCISQLLRKKKKSSGNGEKQR